MTTRATNNAIAAFREVMRHEAHAGLAWRALMEALDNPDIDLGVYQKVTSDIQEAVEEVMERHDLADNTMKSYLSNALNQGRVRS